MPSRNGDLGEGAWGGGVRDGGSAARGFTVPQPGLWFFDDGKGKLYLFVKDGRRTAHCRCPGVVEGTRFGTPYLLGTDGTRGGGVGAEGAVVGTAGLLQGEGYMPVVVVTFTGQLGVRPAATVGAGADGGVALETGKGDGVLWSSEVQVLQGPTAIGQRRAWS